MATIRLVPSTYQVSSNYLTVSDSINMYTNTDSTTHGTCTHNRATSSVTYYLYLRGFNFSDIPSNAEVTGWTLKIKASATGHTTSTSTSYMMTACNGTSALSGIRANGRLSTSVQTFTFEDMAITPTSWDTISGYGSSFGIRIPLRRASSSTKDVVSIYGADIEVTYVVGEPATVTSSIVGEGSISPSGATSTVVGATYELRILPPSGEDSFADYDVTATKNNVDITNDLVASTYLLQSIYTYTYTVDGDATIVITVTSHPHLFMKVNGTWQKITMYRKTQGTLTRWFKVTNPTTYLSTSNKYKEEEN